MSPSTFPDAHNPGAGCSQSWSLIGQDGRMEASHWLISDPHLVLGHNGRIRLNPPYNFFQNTLILVILGVPAVFERELHRNHIWGAEWEFHRDTHMNLIEHAQEIHGHMGRI